MSAKTFKRRRGASQRGFTLVATAVSAVVILGALGLAFDLGRAYLNKAELQAYADTAAVAAAYELDGTQQGIDRANTVAVSGIVGVNSVHNAWDFDSKLVAGLGITDHEVNVHGLVDPKIEVPLFFDVEDLLAVGLACAQI